MPLNLAEIREIFREYDIRGVYPAQINEELARAVAGTLAEKVFKRGKIVVGHDARQSSPSLYEEIVGTLKNYPNLEVIEAEMVTTPMLHFLIGHLAADGGIMITASHNPKEHNGIKVTDRQMIPIGGRDLLKLLA